MAIEPKTEMKNLSSKPPRVSKLKQQLNEWKSRSPLRQWRLEHGISMRDAAGVLGVNLWTIQAWENGNSYPRSDNMMVLMEKLGDEDLSSKWIEWWKDGPEGKGSHSVAKGVLYRAD